MIDLHCHTTASDGEYSPKEVVSFAKEKNLSVLAVTDHDTVAGLFEAKKAARDSSLLLIPGIELNITYSKRGEFHLLGYGLENITSQMQELINVAQKRRFFRNQQIAKKINDILFPCDFEEIAEYAKTSCNLLNVENLGRPHFADYLVKKGYAKNRSDAFAKYLKTGKPLFVRNMGVDIEEAICAVSSCGGVCVIAHPLSLHITMRHLSSFLDSLKEKGLSGIEAWHSGTNITQAQNFETLAKKKGLFVTAGSDFHGAKLKPNRFLGMTNFGNTPIEDRFYFENLKPALENKKA